VIVRLGMFISSYAFLFFILGLRFQAPLLVAACLALAIVGVGAAAWILSSERAKAPAAFVVKSSEDRGPQVVGYLGTYLLPFVAVEEPAGRLVLGYALFLLVAMLVYVQSDMIQINPILYLFGRRVVKITTEPGWTAYLITREIVLPGETILATTLAPGVLVRTGGPEATA
jgi:hypothetical protein